MTRLPILPAVLAALAPFLTAPAAAQDWTNFGGNPARNGRTPVHGPDAADLLWSNADDFSIISWQPVTLGERVFAIRESGFPGAQPNDDLVAYDLDTGTELWREVVPYGGDPNEEWIAYVGGANGGRVYCARGGSGRTTPVYAFDAATGALVWTSTFETEAGPQDGFVFAPDGDPVVADLHTIARLDAMDGSVVWNTARLCPVSGNCGVAITDVAAFFDEPEVGGNVVTKLDLATGQVLYSSPVMPGFTAQNAPFVSADGQTVYFARSQNNAAVDRLYAFHDDGAQLVELWNVPVRWTTSHEHGIADDGSIYTFNPADEFVRLDPLTGAETANAGVLAPLGSPNLSPRTAVDGAGRVYVSNGWANDPATNGRVWAFDGDLTQVLFTLTLNRQNSGGPSLGRHGTLVVADRSGVYAYRAPDGPIGTSYCTPNRNSTGFPALLSAAGSEVLANDNVTFVATGLPANQFGYFLTSMFQDAIPVSNGILCLGAPQFRFSKFVLNSGVGGTMSFTPDFETGLPAGVEPEPGETWHFQLWHRDGTRSNFSDGLSLTFL